MNKNVDWLTRFIFLHSRQTLPDGRPLYAYKCGDKKYAELTEQTKELVALDLKGKSAPRVGPIFCLYAAETFCREHAEGPWAWETVFKPLEITPPAQPQIAEWVRKGLDWWRRPLIRGQHGDRRFLVTIACEGGLPLRLLQNENTKLTQFFRAILDGYHSQGCGGPLVAEAIAHQRADCLPLTLRQEVVFHLGGELIAQIVDLQRRIGDAPAPIAALDERQEDWRHQLPLRVEDKTAEALFKGLVQRSLDLVVAKAARLRWRGRLRETPAGFQVEKRLALPERLTGPQVRAWIGQTAALKPRLRLMLHTPSGSEAVAWLTLIQGSEDSAIYRREWLRRGGLTLIGTEVLRSHSLTLHDGQIEHHLTVQDGEPWDDLPWVFIARGESNEPEWLTEGSAQTRAEQAWVLVDDALVPRSEETGGHVCLGNIAELGRTVYRVNGQVDFLTPEKDCYRIRCRAEGDSDETFSLSGETLTETVGQRPVYKGLPNVQATDAEGKRRFLTGRIQWRPEISGTQWRDGDANALGRIWLRLIAPGTGVEQFRRQIDVVPRSFRLERTIGSGGVPGSYGIYALSGFQLHASPDQPVRVSTSGSEAIVDCPALPSKTLRHIELNLLWPGAAPIPLVLSYPQRGAVFQLAGRPLQRDDLVPLDRLGGLQLILQDPTGGSRFWLDGEFIAPLEPGGEPRPRLGFRDRLPALEGGRLEIPAFPWHDRIASLLASSRALEACLRLEICTSMGESLARVFVARFDVLIEPNREARRVCVKEDSLTRLGPDWESRVRLEIVPLWALSEPPIPLLPCADQPAGWDLPALLQPGPWWIIGRDGGWARFRPLLWSVPAEEVTPDESAPNPTLAVAIRQPQREQREQSLNALLAKLGESPSHPDWPQLFAYVRLAREFPPSSLDVLRLLIGHPRTLAMALIKADDDTFDRVWSFSEQMPFSWSLVPVRDWQAAAGTYFEHLRAALGTIDADGEMVFRMFQSFRERTTARREYWRPLCDWLQERLFPNLLLQGSELEFARRPGADFFMGTQIQQAEQELLGRHDADEIWPQSEEVIGRLKLDPALNRYGHLHPVFRPVRCAPFVTAYLSVKGIPPSETLIHELRLLRAFDSEWFDTVYTIALTSGLVSLAPEISA
jgi:hypothetical protein